MNKLLLSLALVIMTVSTVDVQASNLGTCMVDSLNGKERKTLARWIYFAIAAHPEMKPYANIDTENRLRTDKTVGALVTRLLTEDCKDQFVAVMGQGPTAIKQAFGLVGRVAMQELMTNKTVEEAITGYAIYVDKDKIKALEAAN